MVPFARELHREGARSGVAVWSLRYRVRGWNGAEASPVADARWALAEVRSRHGDVPVVLVGHSMGGRTALRVGDDPSVVGIVALAPWLPPDEPRVPLTGRRLLVVHGTLDRWTDPLASHAYVEQAAGQGVDAVWVPIEGQGHFMLRTRDRWRSLTSTFVRDGLAGQAGLPPAPKSSRHA
jgi:pimeloyl-ACP methyl ester carboxylesterase